ncbi:MAG: response regulator [Pseudomonadota bacterium]
MRILIVDDNEAAADTLGELLSLGGHCVRMVYTGEEAIEAMSEFNPDVVLLDIGLPNSNGFDVARKLRSLPNAQHFLLVAVTGYGQSALQQSASKDFDEYFVKPMSFDKLESIGLHV